MTKGRPISLHIVHRSRLFGQLMHSVLNQDGFLVTEESAEVVPSDLATAGRSNVILVDVSIPGDQALSLIRAYRLQHPDARIVIMVPSAAQGRVIESVACGVHGCVLEEASLDELKRAIHCVAEGGTFCSELLVRSLFQQVSKLTRATPTAGRTTQLLSQRELEILSLMSAHLSNKEIAKKLCVSIFTVKNHVHNILEKLQVQSRAAAVDFARERDWITI